MEKFGPGGLCLTLRQGDGIILIWEGKEIFVYLSEICNLNQGRVNVIAPKEILVHRTAYKKCPPAKLVKK